VIKKAGHIAITFTNKGFKFSMLLFYLKTIATKSMIAEAIHLTRTDSSALS